MTIKSVDPLRRLRHLDCTASRESYPSNSSPLTGERSLLQETALG